MGRVDNAKCSHQKCAVFFLCLGKPPRGGRSCVASMFTNAFCRRFRGACGVAAVRRVLSLVPLELKAQSWPSSLANTAPVDDGPLRSFIDAPDFFPPPPVYPLRPTLPQPLLP